MPLTHLQLIKGAIVPGLPASEGFQAVADFLSDEQYFQPLAKMLEAFDATVPPSGLSRSFEGLNTVQAVDLVASAVSGCVPLFQSLLYAKRRSARLKTYVAKCAAMILERWAAIVKWMAYLVTHATYMMNHKNIVRECTDALYSVLAGRENATIKQELWFTHGTAQLVYLLLCQESQAGEYLILQTFGVIGGVCAIARLFGEGFEDASVLDVMRLEWKSQTPQVRRSYAAALIGRVRQMARTADSFHVFEMVTSVYWLVSATIRLTGDNSGQITLDLESQGFLFEFASAITTLADKAQRHSVVDRDCWEAISRAMAELVSFVLHALTNSQRFMPRIVEGGIVRCASLCLPWDNPQAPYGRSGAVAVLQWIVPFLTKSNIHSMVEERGDFDYFLEGKEDPHLPPNVRKICQEVSAAALLGRQAAAVREGAKLSMCSNTKVHEVNPTTGCMYLINSAFYWQHLP